jgi:hypothetical protein
MRAIRFAISVLVAQTLFAGCSDLQRMIGLGVRDRSLRRIGELPEPDGRHRLRDLQRRVRVRGVRAGRLPERRYLLRLQRPGLHHAGDLSEDLRSLTGGARCAAAARAP